ncbi:MAG: hypothetical protein KDA58_03710 [Planctomycetaceae bacterium]|nr:hypothetical protein [Planctomycetaceae bacterium]
MAVIAINELLNDLLIAIHRSLVLFADEVSPWASESAQAFQSEVTSLAQRQRVDVGRIAALLNQRGEAIDFSYFPHEFTSLHFVSLDYLAERLIAGQRELVSQLEAAVDGLSDDPQAQEVLRTVATSQREGLVQLLASAPK